MSEERLDRIERNVEDLSQDVKDLTREVKVFTRAIQTHVVEDLNQHKEFEIALTQMADSIKTLSDNVFELKIESKSNTNFRLKLIGIVVGVSACIGIVAWFIK